MLLEGSCHCHAVTFSVESSHPYPFNYCYCSICRKTSGGGGYAINLSGVYESLSVQGEEHISVYYAKMTDSLTNKITTSPAGRHFCKECGTALWLYDPRWPELVHPLASVIDTGLPAAPERTHLMLASKASWVEVEKHPDDKLFPEFPDESIAQWHDRLGLEKA